jgi:D-alanine transaminase
VARFAYVNGRYVPHAAAMVHIEDRGYQFADGVYEVVPLSAGRFVDEDPHFDRLDRSLRELRIPWAIPRRALSLVMRELVARNRVRDGLAYIQMTRGVAPRDHKFPKACKPALVLTTKRTPPLGRSGPPGGVGVITIPDIRWRRCDIKSVALLANVLGKQRAVEAGAYEAWQVDDRGFVTEGTTTNAWIVTKGGEVVTRNASEAILDGITRRVVMELVQNAGLGLAERSFTVAEAKAASEAFLTSSSNFVLAVTRIDGEDVGSGVPGPLTERLARLYLASGAAPEPPA